MGSIRTSAVMYTTMGARITARFVPNTRITANTTNMAAMMEFCRMTPMLLTLYLYSPCTLA